MGPLSLRRGVRGCCKRNSLGWCLEEGADGFRIHSGLKRLRDIQVVMSRSRFDIWICSSGEKILVKVKL